MPSSIDIQYSNLIKLVPINARTHKYQSGMLLIIGSFASEYRGASVLAAKTAQRAGSGLVVAITHKDANISFNCLSVINYNQQELFKNQEKLNSLIKKANAIVIGPGLGQSKESEAWLSYVIQKVTDKPVVIDADGLNILAKLDIKKPLSNCILTPHLGEAARLLNCEIDKVEANKNWAVTEIAKHYKTICILKGPNSLICDNKNLSKVVTISKDCPALATAGTGDVLAGLIGSLCAQQLDLFSCANLGVVIHLKAAMLASNNMPKGMLAEDLIDPIRILVNPIENPIS